MKFFKILRKYLEKFGPWATIWANGPLQFSNPKTGPGLGQNDSAQAHSGPNPKNGFTKARVRPGRAWAWPELIPSFYVKSISTKYLIRNLDLTISRNILSVIVNFTFFII